MLPMTRKPKVHTDSKQKIEAELGAIRKRIKTRREFMGLTQAQLAERLECEVTTIQAYEQGRRNPSLPTLIQLCKILRLSLKVD